MLCAEEKSLLVAEFDGLVRKHFVPDVLRSLFEERSGRAEFGSTTRTLLCVESPSSGPIQREGVLASLARMAPQHDGTLDPCTDAFAFVSFADAHSALQMAVALLRAMARARLRMALASGRCQIALCSAAGQDFMILLGRERARVRALALRAAPGTLQLAPEAYEALQTTIGKDLGSCVVLAEFEGGELTEVSLTLPPDRSAELSSFAGLGLT
ncbi:hypothetical protein [Ramlibacter sp. AN1133]|uniref:hypothetical protein n=1 Tax=Ramlibacter sp. AN1133 TaxID=3133429 RepID=UPI0030BADF65